MSFETKIADHLLTLKQDRNRAVGERADMYHDCDCEHCDYSDELSDNYTDDDLEAMDLRIAEIDKTIINLVAHAKLHNIDLKRKIPQMRLEA